jgi:putative sterol carrier protein
MPSFANLTELFNGLPGLFRADKAKDVKAVLAFHLSGADAANYWIHIDNGTIKTGQGEPPSAPDLILKATGDDFLKIMNGQMNPMTAFMQGKVKAEKNMALATKLMSWFGLS